MADISKKKQLDLQKELADKRKSLRGFRFGIAGSKIKNIKEARNLRKEAARILTELNKRRLSQ